MNPLTLVYITNRREPHFDWFADAVHRQGGGAYEGLHLIVVDFYANDPQRRAQLAAQCKFPSFLHVPPKPTPWQGHYRLTTRDYFAASNTRNTAICYCATEWCAFADDLSLPMPGWLSTLRNATTRKGVTLGSYKKVYEMRVEQGELKSCRDDGKGEDSRWALGKSDGPVHATGGMFFGCSFVAPLAALLDINGFDEDCDGMGAEDYIAGLMLEHCGWPLWYDRRLLTLESEEGHYAEASVPRFGKGKGQKGKDFAMLRAVRDHGRKRAPNYFGPEGLAGMRRRILSGEPFPTAVHPQHDWYDGQPLKEL